MTLLITIVVFGSVFLSSFLSFKVQNMNRLTIYLCLLAFGGSAILAIGYGFFGKLLTVGH